MAEVYLHQLVALRSNQLSCILRRLFSTKYQYLGIHSVKGFGGVILRVGVITFSAEHDLPRHCAAGFKCVGASKKGNEREAVVLSGRYVGDR